MRWRGSSVAEGYGGQGCICAGLEDKAALLTGSKLGYYTLNILQQIMDERRVAVAHARLKMPIARLEEILLGRRHHSLCETLRNATKPCIVAEMKKASPSAGLLRPDYDPVAIAEMYEVNGAHGLSVLTEPEHFQGCGEHLRRVRHAVNLPILRKDFMCDPYQVYEAAAWGADVILIIIAALDYETIRELYKTALDCGLDVLAEAHTATEVDTALSLDQAIIGVNSRDLKTLKTDLAVARELSAHIPADRLAIAESGIRSGEDVASLFELGYRGFLVGEVLMKHPDPPFKLRELVQSV